MDSVSPVYDEETVQYEKVLAIDQPEYLPIIVLPINFDCYERSATPHMFVVRFRFTDEERAKIAAGADILIGELVFGRYFTPLSTQIIMPNESPEKL